MGKNCRLNGALACSKPGSTSSNNNDNNNAGFPVQPAGDPRPQCSTLSSAQSANPSASFSCIASSGKQETLSCTVNGVTNTFTGKKKKVISWATSSSCSSSSGGASSGGSSGTTSGGVPSCNCQAEVANFANIRVWPYFNEKQHFNHQFSVLATMFTVARARVVERLLSRPRNVRSSRKNQNVLEIAQRIKADESVII